MKSVFLRLIVPTALLGGLLVLPIGVTRGDEKASKKKAVEIPELNLLDAVRAGEVSVNAEGIGDGRMMVSVTNNSPRKLNVVLPPGLVASGATGQFGGMGGMGGGMMGGMGGGMGGMGGGMGGMGGGMGGMGGGMGGMGGGMGGMGGGMGGGMRGGMGGGTMPASMGMMMLGRLIMNLVGDRDSWNQASLMIGMMGGGMRGGMGGGMGGGMMGGMGGGMGGMGGGMGGFGSVPPTGNPFATLNPGQTRNLPTRLVSLNGPGADALVALPAKGELLQLGDIAQLGSDTRTQAAMKRLAEDKAPTSISQLVLWNVSAGLDWPTIAGLSRSWANASEITLARHFVSTLDSLPKGETGRIYVEVKGNTTLADDLGKLFKDYSLLGLKVESGVPARPQGPAVACSIQASGDDLTVQIRMTDEQGQAWVSAGKFDLRIAKKDGKLDSPTVANSVASGVLSRLVRADLVKGKKVKGKDSYTVRIGNYSPLILNGLALSGGADNSAEALKMLSGISISPRKSLTVPATNEVVDHLGLKKGIRILAADLSGL
jgi:hypothetical protein